MRVFISYRRDDSLSESREIHTKLERASGASDSVFIDNRQLEMGTNWPDDLRREVQDSDVVLVVVKDPGKWLGVDATYGTRRIDAENDWVRNEVHEALTGNKKVIPVLVGDSPMIPGIHLPEPLRSLADKQCITLGQNWDNDLRQLSEHLFPCPLDSPVQEPRTEHEVERALAERCEATLRDFNRKCVEEWNRSKPSRFVEPHLAIRRPDQIADRSESHHHESTRQSHEPLLSAEEKQQPGLETALEQYRRLFEQRRQPSRPARICVTEDAGSGKSVFSQHLRGLLADTPGQVEFFDGQAGLVVRWEGREKSWPFDLRAALEQEVSGCCRANGVTAQDVVDYAFSSGNICLILDALDQVTDDFTPEGHPITRSQLLDRVFRFLNSEAGRACHVVITGRSYTVTRGIDGERFPKNIWTFATLEGFNRTQQERYLHDFAADRSLEAFIPSYDDVAELFEVPVILNLIAEIAEADPRPAAEVCLEQFQTRGDVYREAHEKLADRAGKAGRITADFTSRARWEAVLSAAAFVMMGDRRQRRNYTVDGRHSVEKFRASVAQCVRDYGGGSLSITDDDWDQLAEFSQLTNHASVDHCSGLMLSWKHRGWMEYFAGLYLARYAPDAAVDRSAPFSNDPDWHWVWRFAIEMPDNVADPERQTAVLTSLFQRPSEGRRPSELMYWAWNVMTATPSGSRVLRAFESDYRDLLLAGNPLARAIEDSFRPCPPDPAVDSLTFLMGSPETDHDARSDEQQVEMTVTPFHMACVPTSVGQYCLYDPAHHDNFECDDYPVVDVTWYDAWCFARWCGSRLPNEVHWEYACRAGTTTRYWWNEQMDDSKCNFDGHSPTAASKAHANPWRLMDMSGNVWEWCDTWYDEDLLRASQTDHGEFRVLRGGSFYLNLQGDLRSAARYCFTPDTRDYNVGFRVSRTR